MDYTFINFTIEVPPQFEILPSQDGILLTGARHTLKVVFRAAKTQDYNFKLQIQMSDTFCPTKWKLLTAHENYLCAMSMAKDGSALATSSYDSTAKASDLAVR